MDAGHTITSNSRGAHPQAVAVSDGTAFASQGPQLQPAHELRYVSAEKSTLRDRKRGVGLARVTLGDGGTPSAYDAPRVRESFHKGTFSVLPPHSPDR